MTITRGSETKQLSKGGADILALLDHPNISRCATVDL